MLTGGISIAGAAQNPNIVFILADDLGYGDLACFGGKDVKTPNIDSLARDGMKLTSFYVHQRCSPSRLAFMTGSYAHRAGSTKVIYRRDRTGIHPAEITTPELLKQAGYNQIDNPEYTTTVAKLRTLVPQLQGRRPPTSHRPEQGAQGEQKREEETQKL